MAIYIQKIQTNWTKLSRGYPGASARNQVPEKLPLKIDDVSNSVFLQEILYREGGFDKPHTHKVSKINTFQIRQQRLELDDTANGLAIKFWTEDQIRKNIGTLAANTWCQIKTNRRYPMEYTWGYYKIVFNIFYGEPDQAQHIFKNQESVIQKDYQTLLK